mmetsp:Transcript_15850/g.31679  ORF Transcript_15850/g.31679 Transcript_15850/m.31679 type:complete len:271 (+) Transcript_15850:2-814(+)
MNKHQILQNRPEHRIQNVPELILLRKIQRPLNIAQMMRSIPILHLHRIRQSHERLVHPAPDVFERHPFPRSIFPIDGGSGAVLPSKITHPSVQNRGTAATPVPIVPKRPKVRRRNDHVVIRRISVIVPNVRDAAPVHLILELEFLQFLEAVFFHFEVSMHFQGAGAQAEDFGGVFGLEFREGVGAFGHAGLDGVVGVAVAAVVVVVGVEVGVGEDEVAVVKGAVGGGADLFGYVEEREGGGIEVVEGVFQVVVWAGGFSAVVARGGECRG